MFLALWSRGLLRFNSSAPKAMTIDQSDHTHYNKQQKGEPKGILTFEKHFSVSSRIQRTLAAYSRLPHHLDAFKVRPPP
jgi:hypothetical protein